MKIALNEIWNFIDLIKQEEKGWSYDLIAGSVRVEQIDHSELLALKSDEEYDTELLPSLFTFREILWQPDVFTETAMSLPGLRILQAFCNEMGESLQTEENRVRHIYAQLIFGLGEACQQAIEKLETGNVAVIKALRDLRQSGFPIIKFFIYHPQNRLDYHRDAINRLNYAVKVMLTQFHGRYTELEDPFWQVSYKQQAKSKKSEKPPVEEES